jgi:hypothetical protein
VGIGREELAEERNALSYQFGRFAHDNSDIDAQHYHVSKGGNAGL